MIDQSGDFLDELRFVSHECKDHPDAEPSVVDHEPDCEPNVAITGPSGGGKSTLVKLLLGLIEPDSGEVLIDGLPIAQFGHKSYHSQIAGFC